MTETQRQRQHKLIATGQWSDKELRRLTIEAATEISNIALHQDGLWLTQSGWLNPGSLCQSLLAAAAGIDLRTDCRVARLQHTGSGWQLYDETDRLLSKTGVVVIASGKDAASLQQSRWLPLSLVRGQTSWVYATTVSRKLRTVVCANVYLTPAIGDRHILGATFQRDDIADDLRNSDDAWNLSQLTAFAPELAAALGNIESQHAAIRSVTPDRLPVVGAVPDYAAFQEDYAELWKGKAEHYYPSARHLTGLYLAAGFGARGITTAPLAAELLAAMIDGTELPLDNALVDVLNPARFLIKRLRRAAIDPDQTIQ
jgi:tRNA 5-methylaminomethyl-2-thiouridine biosynthesis bifunctional protein